MKLERNDRYQISIKFSSDSLESLDVLFMPLIGFRAAGIYHLLYAEGKEEKQINEIQRLLVLTGLNEEQLQQEITVLEQNTLLKTLKRKSDGLINFELQQPCSFRSFFKEESFARAYYKKVGEEQFKLTMEKYLSEAADNDEFVDVSAKPKISGLDGWDDDNEDGYQKVRKLDNYFEENNIEISFDYQSFYQEPNMSFLFPDELRTAENMKYIGELATMFNLNHSKMRDIVTSCVDSDGVNTELLYRKCVREAGSSDVLSKEETDYDISPIEFLKNRQHGRSVILATKNLLTSLQTEMGLKQEVINVLVEYVLENNNNRLSRNYIETIASTWMRNGIDSKEKAFEALKEEFPAKKSRRSSGPSFNAEEELKTEDADIEQLRKSLFGQED